MIMAVGDNGSQRLLKAAKAVGEGSLPVWAGSSIILLTPKLSPATLVCLWVWQFCIKTGSRVVSKNCPISTQRLRVWFIACMQITARYHHPPQPIHYGLCTQTPPPPPPHPPTNDPWLNCLKNTHQYTFLESLCIISIQLIYCPPPPPPFPNAGLKKKSTHYSGSRFAFGLQ